jgi:hypothetical protein
MLLGGAAVAAAIAMTVAGTVIPARATTVTTTPWRVAHIWGTAAGRLDAVAATGPANAWAIGSLYQGSTPSGPLVAHWNGTAWQTVTPAVVKGYSLYEISASSPGNVWMLGLGASSLDQKAFRFDGAHWHAVALPPIVNATPRDLIALGSAEAWVSGSAGTSGAGQPFTDVWHWSGSAWTNHPIGASIDDMAGISDSNLQAAGRTGQALRAYKWTGRRWIAMGIPSASGQTPAIAMDAANDVWIGAPSPDGRSAFALHWNGRAWSRVNAPKDVTAFGTPTPDGHGGVWLGTLAYWTGHAWIDADFVVPPPGAHISYTVGPVTMAKVPGTAGSYWGAGYEQIDTSPARPAMWLYGPKP